MNRSRIIVDAMGGDNAPDEIIKGSVEALQENENIDLIFVGDEPRLQPLLMETPVERYRISHTSEFITMEEAPKEAVEKKSNASINLAAQMIAAKEGDCLISAGNTGATILACSKHISRLPGIERGALAAVFPAMKQKEEDPGRSIMLDVGATLHCTAHQLVQFAIMGMHYAQAVMGVENPRVGLLNIGEEATKGSDVLVETHALLRESKEINFTGNIEGKDIFRGSSDVIISEGMVGNILLKAMEGVGEMAFEIIKNIWQKGPMHKTGLLLLSRVLKKLKRRLDYTEYGGAPILGFERLIIKSHGRSDAKTIKNAVLMADTSLKHQLVQHMEESIHNFYEQLFKKSKY